MNTKYALVASLLLCSGNAFAQSVNNDPTAIIEIGAAPSRSVTGGGTSFGPDLAVEVTPIDNWLEIEAGATLLFNRDSTEWAIDVLFKKPWTLSDKVEFMAGAGTTNAPGVEVAADFMFWPSIGKHKFGWFLEPAYDYSFGRGHEQLIGISGGLLIGVATRRAKAKRFTRLTNQE